VSRREEDAAVKYILFLMFLVTPPSAGKTPDWALQSVNSMEFNTWTACNNAAQDVVKSINKTKTITVVAWCFETGAVGADKEEAAPETRSNRRVPPSRPSQRLQLD
jgi:hypothetical protein